MVSNFIKRYAENMPAEQTTLQDFLSNIKDQLNDHLETINANTTEIQTNYEYLCELDSKIEKLNEKLDEIMMFIGVKKEFSVEKGTRLTLREQEVFWLLHLNKKGMSIKELAKKLGLTEYLARNYINSIASKNIPLLKKELNDETFVCIDPSFREVQEKSQIIAVSETVKQQICG